MTTDDARIDRQLQRLRGWAFDASPPSIHKTWTFDSFESVVKFFNQVAQLAIAHDHHPEVWSSHTRLRIRLWTHDASGLTDKDFALAEAIDQLAAGP